MRTKTKEILHITHVDANDLYGFAMAQPPSQNDLKLDKDSDIKNIVSDIVPKERLKLLGTFFSLFI